MGAVRFERVAVIGVGLIGGSFALALKTAGACRAVIGVGRSAENIASALELGAIDKAVSAPQEAVRGADLVLISTPVARFPEIFAAIGPQLDPRAVVTDAGSTKQDVVAAARAGLGARIDRFVPGHPIAGGEQSGVGAARADLFRGKRVIVAPMEDTDPVALATVEAAWTACGGRLSRMSPVEHDAVFAAVSHLPHVLAYALVDDIARRDNAARLFGFAGAGFRDFTRIASSHPEMWRDICLANRDALLADLDRYAVTLGTLRALIAAGDGAALERAFSAAREARERWLNGHRDE